MRERHEMACQECKQWTFDGSMFVCSVCGNKKQIQDFEEPKHCQACGTPYSKVTKFCSNCGLSLQDKPEIYGSKSARNSESEGRKFLHGESVKKYSIVIISFVSLLILLFAVVQGLGDEKVSNETSYENDLANTSEIDSEFILNNLNASTSYNWQKDESENLTNYPIEAIYFGGDCAVWVFPSYSSVESASKNNLFDFYNGEVWLGTEVITSKGIALLTENKNAKCSKEVFEFMGWAEEDTSISNDSVNEKTEAYWTGYESNQGSVLAYVEMAESRYTYCSANSSLHYFSLSDKQDYIRGCLDVLQDSFGAE